MASAEKTLISFIIPCYASENSVGLVIDEIRKTVSERPEFSYQIIAVNDCSPDNVFSTLRSFAENDRNIIAVDLAKNTGRHNALICGCHLATGDIIVFIDDDLQCPTDRLWDLIDPLLIRHDLANSYDVSIARYPKKKQAGWKNAGSKLNDVVSTWLLGKNKNLKFSNFSAMKSFVKDEIVKYSNPYPYLSGLMLRSTSRICNVEMEERERTIGTSHYSFRKSLSLWLNSFTAFSVKPLRVATVCGFSLAATGSVSGIYVIARRLLVPSIAVGYSSIMATMLFIGGITMIMLGLIGEYIGRIYISLNNAPQYVIRELVRDNTQRDVDAMRKAT